MQRIVSIVVSMLVACIAGFHTTNLPHAEAAASLAKFEPPDGYAYAGSDADQRAGDTAESSKTKWDDWTRLMGGKPAAISHTFEGFDVYIYHDLKIAEARNATPLITWQTGSTTPKTIAQAGNTSSGESTDEVILRTARISADHDGSFDGKSSGAKKPIFLRVDQEMNAHWFKWSAYNEDGSARSSTAKDFRDMWKRMVIVFRGGYVRDVNARLAAEGLPPLDTNITPPSWLGLPSISDPDSYLEPADNVAFVWNPVDAPGIPDVSGNRWLDYYPGDGYVDWVGQTSYNLTWNATMSQRFRWLEEFYQEFSARRGKPYMLGEWGVAPEAHSGFGDNPNYIDQMLDWQRTHPKVKALIYFSVQMSSGDYRLSSYPNSAKALAAGVQQSRFLGELRPGSPSDGGTPDDTAAPMVTSVRPADGSGGVSLGTNVAAAFSEEMDPATLDASTVTLHQKQWYQVRKKVRGKVRRVWTYRWVPVSAQVTYDAATKTATLDPSSDLAASSSYAATVTTGAKDAAGNALAQSYSWTFTTGST